MTSPIFDKVITHPTLHTFPSRSESDITKLEIKTSSGLRELEIHFASREAALNFCRKNSFVADFAWLNFVTFEGHDLARIRKLLEPYFQCEKVKEQFENLTKKLMDESPKQN